ncbi:glyoxylate/succinic semialdehyde reductase 1-like isoform X2 [Cornus florida]|uniref:glyoxylate/succinic semialdehyde reductase 1-like isoform X2 n=1 Tax=Cornus florida TaxID=4283 RepID=UPI00289EE671|nr:glyoxylate/succinic semialdehyde reductase 1-like isoform X2 [Cornus florida]
MEEEIGLLGLGIMGMAMSRTLLRHGANLTVWNRTPSKCEQLVEYGASVAETAAAVVKKCKYTIAMLSDPSAALSVVFDKDGVLEQICKGKGYIDMSTVDADTSSKISEAITSKGGSFLEAPVSGSRKLAQDGELVILAAGVKALYEEAHCLFDIMGKKTFFLGHVGNGAKMKLLVNMLMGSEEPEIAGESVLHSRPLRVHLWLKIQLIFSFESTFAVRSHAITSLLKLLIPVCWLHFQREFYWLKKVNWTLNLFSTHWTEVDLLIHCY